MIFGDIKKIIAEKLYFCVWACNDVLFNTLKVPIFGGMAGCVMLKKWWTKLIFCYILETIYYTEINVQIKNKVDKIPRSLIF